MGLRCGVYWNSHKRLFSIRNEDASTQELPDYHYGKVIAHAQHVWMGQSSFQVSEAGRERAQDEGRKNVHARVLGDVIAIGGQWHFPNSAGDGKLLRDRYCNIDLFKPMDLMSARAKVDENPSLGATGIWRQTGAMGLTDSEPGTHSVHYSPWAGPAFFTTFTNKGVWSVQTVEAVELSCMIADTDDKETLRRPCITIPVVGSVISEIEEFTNVTETI
tara:strand:- start:384 stop:1037 length:654 start_codon:yes stop_codon:yes gene_type:complete